MDTLPTRVWKSTSIKVSLFLLLISFLVVSGCGPNNPISGAQTALAITRTPIPTATATCIPGVAVTSAPLALPPKLIVILFQTQGWDNANVTRANEIVNNVLPLVVEPGDKVVMFAMGIRGFVDAQIANAHTDITSRLAVPSTPTQVATLTAVPTPLATNQSSLGESVAERDATATQASSNLIATQYAREYDCALAVWKGNYGDIATAWAATKIVSATNFEATIQANIARYQGLSGSASIPTPIPNSVFESLTNATIVFENECSNYGRCMLIIFSDLEDWRKQALPKDQHINLNNVDVVSVMLNCKTIYQPSCSNLQDIWTANFKTYKAMSVQYRNNDGIEDYLTNYLGR